MPRRSLVYFSNFLLIMLTIPIGWVSYVEIGKILGYRPVPVEVAGTGSMYPSLFWDESQGGPEQVELSGVEEYRSSPRMYHYFSGINIGNQLFLKKTLQYGDMVAFSSAKTAEILRNEGKDPTLGFIKRIIGLPGDKIELKDGYVIRSGEVISEPYIRSPRSTYGGAFLPECREVTVPPNSYFVLGDNRKVSSDSRYELGFVSDQDIMYFLPLSSQQLYQSLWRDSSADLSLSGTASLNSADFYQKIPRLKPNKQLEKSAKLRGEALLKDQETSYDLKRSLSAAGYTNIVTGEFVIFGSYTADELYENLFANYATRRQLENADYTELGLSVSVGSTDGCPTQVVVGHLGGYVPATYSADVKESWQQAKNNLNEIIPSWERAVGQEAVDQVKLAELISLLKSRQALVNEVLDIITKREWISPDLQSRINADDDISKRIEKLAKDINKGE